MTIVTPTPASEAPVTARTRSRRKHKRHIAAPWWFVTPALVLYLFAVLVPSIQGSLYSFTNWDGISPSKTYVGLKEFSRVFTNHDALTGIKNTILIGIAVTIVQNVLGLLLALGVNSKIKSRTLLRVIIFAPAVVTSVAVGFLWQNLYTPDGGINVALKGVGLGKLQQDWLGDPNVALWAIVAVVIWQFVGYSMVIFLAGLQGIPEEINEAAAIDGANVFQRFRSITLPLLAPAITINLMLSIIGSLKLFDQVFTTTAGGPGGATNTISTLIYQNAFQLSRFGYAAALAVVLSFFVAIVSGAQYLLLRRQGR